VSDVLDTWEAERDDDRESLASQSARRFFDESFAWNGVTPDPDRTSAFEFLQWLT
jgi:hypothetical protein